MDFGLYEDLGKVIGRQQMTRLCDNCNDKDTCKIYKEEMKSPRASFFQGCLGGFEENNDKTACKLYDLQMD